MEKYKVSYVDLSTGETLAYRKAGTGKKTYVLVHGNLCSSVWFEELMEELSKGDRTLYAIDIPGCGDSSYNRMLESLHDISRDLTEFITKFNLKDVYLLGWSTGGGISLETAADIPERIKSVTLLSALGITGYPIYKKTIFTPLSTELIRTREDMYEFNMMVRPMLSMFKRQNKYLMKGMLERGIYTKRIPNDEYLDKYIDGSLKQRNYIDILTCIVNFNMTDKKISGVYGSGRGKLVKAPVHIIHGDSDVIVDDSYAFETSEYFGAQADIKIFRGCGHSIVTDDFEGLINYLISIE